MIGVHGPVPKTAHPMYTRAAIAKGVEIAGGGEEGGEVGAEGGDSDGIGEREMDGSIGFFQISNSYVRRICVSEEMKWHGGVRRH